jgi:hypothetical protein
LDLKAAVRRLFFAVPAEKALSQTRCGWHFNQTAFLDFGGTNPNCTFVNGIIVAGQRRHGCCQCHRIDRARDPHPNPGQQTRSRSPRRWPSRLAQGVAPSPGATIAGHEADLSLGGIVMLGPNARRHRVSNDRDMPYRRAVAEICRGVRKLSRTILSFSSSDHDDAGPYPPLRAARLGHCAYHCP